MKLTRWTVLLLIFLSFGLLGLFGFTLRVVSTPKSVFPMESSINKMDSQLKQWEKSNTQADGMPDSLKVIEEAFSSLRKYRNSHDKELALSTIIEYLIQTDVEPAQKTAFFRQIGEEALKMNNSTSKIEVTLALLKGITDANLADAVKEELVLNIIDKLVIPDRSS